MEVSRTDPIYEVARQILGQSPRHPRQKPKRLVTPERFARSISASQNSRPRLWMRDRQFLICGTSRFLLSNGRERHTELQEDIRCLIAFRVFPIGIVIDLNCFLIILACVKSFASAVVNNSVFQRCYVFVAVCLLGMSRDAK